MPSPGAVSIGYHASHEQVPPADLRDAVRWAEDAGFADAMCSDHLAPWSSRQGESAFAFSWLGAALQATNDMGFGQFHAPGQRYHPVVSAQAAATLAAMFPGRYTWMALGSGEYLNEHVTGDGWPRKDVRMARLRECVDVMRALWSGDEVSHDGLVRVDRARVWTLPERPVHLLAGAISASTARWAAAWADGLITVNQDRETLEDVAGAYREGGGRGPLCLQVHISYHPSRDTALATAVRQWRSNCLPTSLAWNLALPEQFEAASRFVPDDEVQRAVVVVSDPAELVERLAGYVDLGFERLYLHHVGRRQQPFIDMAGEYVVPAFSAGAA